MKNRIKMVLILIAFASFALFGCDDEVDTVRKNVGTVGCANPTARDNCGDNTHCRIEACN